MRESGRNRQSGAFFLVAPVPTEQLFFTKRRLACFLLPRGKTPAHPFFVGLSGECRHRGGGATLVVSMQTALRPPPPENFEIRLVFESCHRQTRFVGKPRLCISERACSHGGPWPSFHALFLCGCSGGESAHALARTCVARHAPASAHAQVEH